MQKERVVGFLLRIGLASVFGYAALAAFFDPTSWVGYFPAFARAVIPENVLLATFSIGEIILSAWLLWGKHVFFSGAVSAITILGILLANVSLFDILFRDVAIFFAGIALAYIGTDEAS